MHVYKYMKKYFYFLFLMILFAVIITSFTCIEGMDKKQTVSFSETPKRYLALGDSYTIGQSVSMEERFPAQIVSSLREKGVNINDPQYTATTGWTTIDLQNAIIAENLPPAYDAITLLIGVNDQYRGLDTSGYRLRFTQLLKKSVQLAKGNPAHVFVLSVPDYSVTPFAAGYDTARIRKEIDMFNAINKQISLQYNISYTDITPLTKEAKNNASLIANDGLHPSGKEYAMWAALLAPKIKQILLR